MRQRPIFEPPARQSNPEQKYFLDKEVEKSNLPRETRAKLIDPHGCLSRGLFNKGIFLWHEKLPSRKLMDQKGVKNWVFSYNSVTFDQRYELIMSLSRDYFNMASFLIQSNPFYKIKPLYLYLHVYS